MSEAAPSDPTANPDAVDVLQLLVEATLKDESVTTDISAGGIARLRELMCGESIPKPKDIIDVVNSQDECDEAP